MQWLIDLITESVLASLQGTIILWSGLIVDIPEGWALCDGTQGTPDLRNKFIKGTAVGVNPGGTGGAVEHDHDFIGGYHTHGILAGDNIAAGTDKNNVTTEAGIIDVTEAADGQPPYYEMAYIMKL